MKFVSDRVRDEWGDHRLALPTREIVTAVADTALHLFNWEVTLTCVYRTPEEDKKLGGHGVHVVWHAVDIRTRDVKPEYVAAIVNWCNATWRYDPNRRALPIAYAKPHGSGPHLHIQSHANTVRVNL